MAIRAHVVWMIETTIPVLAEGFEQGSREFDEAYEDAIGDMTHALREKLGDRFEIQREHDDLVEGSDGEGA